jgi:hypothetical protein
LSSISRSRYASQSKYRWGLVDADLTGRSLSPKNVQKAVAKKQAAAAQAKPSLLDVLLDSKTKARPAATQGQPRFSNDKDEFRVDDAGTKGMPVRLSSASPREGARPAADNSRALEWRSSNWFADGFDEDKKRTT